MQGCLVGLAFVGLAFVGLAFVGLAFVGAALGGERVLGFSSATTPAAPPDSPFQGTFKHILWHLDEHILVFIHP